jgi:hypothetical protein
MIDKIVISFWCIAVPVVENGDDYFRVSSENIEDACHRAVDVCERQYHTCDVKYCGTGNRGSFIECEIRF